MLTKSISFTNFKIKKNTKIVNNNLKLILQKKNAVIESLSINYKNSYKKKILKKYKSFSNFRIIGMGGSTLGTQAIYDFLNYKIKKNFVFIDNLKKKQKENIKKFVNIIVSKSGNTIETIANANVLIKKNEKNIFITENKINYLNLLAQKLKAEIIQHNNFIGGRYSVLSEVGMVPAELMGLKPENFRQLNQLIKKKKFYRFFSYKCLFNTFFS